MNRAGGDIKGVLKQGQERGSQCKTRPSKETVLNGPLMQHCMLSNFTDIITVKQTKWRPTGGTGGWSSGWWEEGCADRADYAVAGLRNSPSPPCSPAGQRPSDNPNFRFFLPESG
jgi:hypothetical protein